MKPRDYAALVSLLLLAPLAGCSHVAGNAPPPDTKTTTAPTLVGVDGRKYRCFNDDGTLRCEELRALLAGVDNNLPVEASQRGIGTPARR